MPRPGLIHIAKILLPFGAAVGAVVGVSLLSHTSGAPASPDVLLTGLATGLVVNGLSALCKLKHFRAVREYEDTLVNNDIVRLIRNAWGEAMVAVLKAYLRTPRFQGSILNPKPSTAFYDAVAELRPETFFGLEVSSSTIHTMIEESMRALLRNPEHEASLPLYVNDLQNELIDSVVDVLTQTLGSGVQLPADLRAFLAGPNGILRELMIHVAYQLKTDQHAQAAILHFTLQEVSDSQARIETLCKTIYNTLNDVEKAIIDALEQRIEREYSIFLHKIDQKFNDLGRAARSSFAAHSTSDVVRSQGIL